ncbi:MAG: hypothetical protein CVT49_11780 [candidate division Zixibacteria bacterium HGW-Zixibacteria-1]|nr:MAG: hypothetical protein CVT49_11780 [candidate division Zixibacteria bacterium HGW-Zixibacteria-1]
MKKNMIIFGILTLALVLSNSGWAQSSTQLKDLQLLIDSTLLVEAHIFAPKAYEKAEGKLTEAKRAIELQKKQGSVDNLVAESREYAENALKAAEVAKLTLADYLEPRNLAKKANAPVLVPELYQKAEAQFVKATTRVEDGDVKGGLKEAEKSSPLFSEAELQAIKTDIMGGAARLVEKAVTDEAGKYALSTLDRARTAYTRCDNTLTKDRYNRKESLDDIHVAEYEARHASNIAQSVRSLERNDQAWEKLMLLYEIEMQKVGKELGMERLPFDNGPMAAADSLKAAVANLKNKSQKLQEANSEVSSRLTEAFKKLEISVEGTDAVKLSVLLDKAVNEMLADKSRLSSQLDAKAAKLQELESSHEQMASELEKRQEREERLKNARAILNPTEGTVILNATDDIVLRLFGLSFASGSSEITEAHVPLLEKVEQVLNMFPNSKLMVEGHTDDLGERTTNMRLSEKRAFAIMQYLREAMGISADRISATGYGPDKPIGTNTTNEGRAKNRRIDILIFQ